MNKNKASLIDRLNKVDVPFYGEEFDLKDNNFTNKIFDSLKFNQCELKNGWLNGFTLNKVQIRSSHISKSDFTNSKFIECFAGNYFFEECNLSDSIFKDSDFSGGAFDKTDFINSIFENCDFALCEFKDVSFKNAKFTNCNFNASYFQNINLENARYESASFKYVEGLSEQLMQDMNKNGAQVCLPLEVNLKNSIILSINKMNHIFKILIVACVFFTVGIYFKDIIRNISKIFTLESNPLSYPINYLSTGAPPSFFEDRLSLDNFDFSENLNHWWIIPKTKNNVSENIKIVQSTFSSFPQALNINRFDGEIFFIKTKKTSAANNTPLDNENIWMPLNKKGENLKISFYYKNGHPQINVFGRFKEGGYKILAEINSLETKKETPWTFYSEGLKVPSNFDAICLKLNDFPEDSIYMDDINIETTF
ncbi:MAG: hypothetical protein ACD_79C01447G0005 [uncultured bacterium]|nr:MAG: hypothetical protein ACD_79C01447G0005 [uncultured bacterium]